MSDQTGTAILTEHLGFPPIALVDDIINAINAILYKCTDAIEEFLVSRPPPPPPPSGPQSDDGRTHDEESRIKEIELGTAQVESLLEAAVDRNFDLMELYVLRNLLTIPKDLYEEGWMRLEHHEGIDFSSVVGADKKRETDNSNPVPTEENSNHSNPRDVDQLLTVERSRLLAAIEKQRALERQLRLGRRRLQVINAYKSKIEFLTKDTDELGGSLPETITFLISETKELMDKLRGFSDILDPRLLTLEKLGIKNEADVARVEYLNKTSQNLINNLKLQLQEDQDDRTIKSEQQVQDIKLLEGRISKEEHET